MMKTLLASLTFFVCILYAYQGNTQCAPDIDPPICIPQDVTLYLDGNGNANLLPSDIDNGSSDFCGGVTLAIDSSSFDCTELGGNPVVLTVTDEAGNTSSCNSTVTVLDTIAPICMSGDGFVNLFADITITLPGFFIDEGTTDNCDSSPSYTIFPNQFSCDDVGMNPVIFMATDDSGNTCTSDGVVILTERIRPTCITQDVTLNLDATGNITASVDTIDNGTFDPCGVIDFYSVIPNMFDCENLGNNTVTFTARDTSDNECSTTANVFITADFVCNTIDPTVYLDAAGNAAITIADVDNGSGSPCGGAVLSINQSMFDCADVGDSPVTIYLINNAGTMSPDSCEVLVTVLDTVNPVCILNDLTVFLDDSGMVAIDSADVDAGSSDNCMEFTLSINQTNFPCDQVGTNTIDILVNDGHGNETMCNSMVTVMDTTSPVCNVQDVTIFLDATGQVQLVPADVDAGSTDNCGIVTSELSQSDFNCSNVGDMEITLTLVDAENNSSVCNLNVTVRDTISPICIVQDITIQLDENGMATIDSASIDQGSTDNCGILFLGVSQTSFTCGETGINPVIITVNDTNGNSSTCISNVTVEDDSAPSCNVNDLTIFLGDDGTVSIDSAAIDAGSTDNCDMLTLSIGQENFICDDIGNVTVEVTLDDGNGNVVMCDAMISVMDTTSPVCNVQDVTVYLDAMGQGTLEASEVDAGSDDNCGIATFILSETSFDCINQGVNMLSITLEDNEGNVSVCPFMATVIDTFPPTCIFNDLNLQLDANGILVIDSSMVDGGSFDNCEKFNLTIDQTAFSCADIGVNEVNVTVRDETGNEKTGTFTLTIDNVMIPMISCPGDTIVLCTSNVSDLNIFGTPEIVATCGGNVMIVETVFDSLNVCGVGTITRRFVATETGDVNGVDSCFQRISVINNDTLTMNVITFPMDIMLDACSADTDITGMPIIDESMLNCTSITTTFIDDTLNVSCPLSINRNFTITDSCQTTNNEVVTFSMIQEIIVQDTMLPVINCPGNIIVDSDDGSCTAMVSLVITAMDNCGIESIINDSPYGVNGMEDASGMYPVGTTAVTFMAIDSCENLATCTVNVTVSSSVTPTCSIEDLIIQFPTSNQNETVTIDSSDLDITTTGCFPITSIQLSDSIFNCSQSNQSITVTVTDSTGAVSTCNAMVEITGSCRNFNELDTTVQNTNTTTMEMDVLDIWTTNCTSAKYTEGGNGASIDSIFLELINEDCGSSESYIYTDDAFTGNLSVNSGVTALCYDIVILEGDNSLGGDFESLTIFGGGNDPINAMNRAVFQPFAGQSTADNFVTICTPIVLTNDGNPPSNSFGTWRMLNGTWNDLISDLSGVGFYTDYTFNVSRIGIDNLCIRNETSTPPSVTCPVNMTVLCSELDDTDFGTVIIGENCMMEYAVDTTAVVNLDACNTGSIERTINVYNELGNQVSCVQNIQINPPLADFLDAPAPITIMLDVDECSEVVPIPQAIINDLACSDIIDFTTIVDDITINQNGGLTELPAGRFDVTFVGTDECGNVSQAVSQVNLLRPCELSVLELINVSLDETCTGEITPAIVATFPIVCDDYYDISLFDSDGNLLPTNTITPEYVNTLITFVLSEPNCGNTASGIINVEDKFPPQLVCVNDTILCGELLTFPEPTIIEACDDAELVLLNEEFLDVSCQDTLLESIISRTYIAVDASGNESQPCVQMISIRKFQIDSVQAPDFAIEIECGSSFPMDDAGNPDPAFYGGPTINGVDILQNQPDGCNVITIYDDVILELPIGDVIMREFNVFYWSCTIDTSLSFVQVFKFVDSQGPVFTCPSDFTVASNNINCSADLILPTIIAADVCSSIEQVSVTFDGGFVEDGNGAVINLPMGENEVTYTASDASGNSSSCTFIVTVQDQDAPVVVCETFTVAPLPQSGFAEIDAVVFDDGSYDYCDIATYEVRRMDPICDENDIFFGPTIQICCEDLGTNVVVVMRVTDVAGNTNECMVNLEVQDKIAPVLLEDLPDITVSCDYPIDPDNLSVFGSVVNNIDDRDSIILTAEFVAFDGNPLDAFVLDNCISIINDEISETQLNDCGLGFVTREITIEDGQSNTLTINQRIERINIDPFDVDDIVWPLNYDAINVCSADNLLPQDLPEGFGFPILSNTSCDLVGLDFDDSVFDFSNGDEACFKIRRTWTVANWCQQDNGFIDTFQYIQLIKVTNEFAPEITGNCEDIVQCSFDPNCQPAFIELSNTATDDCTDSTNLNWSYNIDLDSDGTIDIEGDGNDASGIYAIGSHTIYWLVLDQCGNEEMCFYTFELQNCQEPLAYCYDNITADLTPMDLNNDGEPDTEMLFLRPEMIDAGSSQGCGQEVILSFSSDVNDTLRTYDCDNIGLNPVSLWVTDENGNQAFCTTSIDVQDNNGVEVCADQLIVDIVGKITNDEQIAMENIHVSLNNIESISTDENGNYAFIDIAANAMYTVDPFKEDAAINGLTTLDIILIQKHILGIEPIENPYRILAADVNDSDDVSGTDIIQIRRLLLGHYDEFPSVESWKFYVEEPFIDPAFPWANNLHEIYDDLVNIDMNIDFIGIKMGDINGSAPANGMIENTITTRENSTLFYNDKALVQGDTDYVDLVLGQAQNVIGFQMELSWDQEYLDIEHIECIDDDFMLESFMDKELGRLRVVAHAQETSRFDKDAQLLRVYYTTKKSDASLARKLFLTSNPRLHAEMYNEALQTRNIRIDVRTDNGVEQVKLPTDLRISQNFPNPFKEETTINIFSPIDGEAILRINDVTGKSLLERKLQIVRGENILNLFGSQLQSTGVLYYSIELDGEVIMKKMLLME